MSQAPLCAFVHPAPAPQEGRVYPVFLPFAGCKNRCLFCAQETQTGQKAGEVLHALRNAENDMQRRAKQGAAPLELAFYGGTFTALPHEEQQACLNFAQKWKQRGHITAVRCSTRPDAVTEQNLAVLREAGVSLVELGVQSFCDAALAASTRGYTGDIAEQGCALVKKAGLLLGIQLMPGMPGLSLANAQADMLRAVALAPANMRLYPCLVVEGTPLAAVWQRGEFVPWEFDETVDFLATACLTAWEHGIAIIRMGLAPEQGLEQQTLAGPRHPALGSMVRGIALARHIAKKIADCLPLQSSHAQPLHLYAPLRYRGEFWGHKKTLVPVYAALGIEPARVHWGEGNEFVLHAASACL